MAEPERGKRVPPGGRETTESQTAVTTQGTAPAPRPRPVASKAKSVGVPMAGQSYAKKQAEEARRAKGKEAAAPPEPAPEPAPRPRPRPAQARSEPDLDLEEDFDLEAELENEPEPERAEPATAGSASKLYSTRRALAEQVNQDVGVRPGIDPDASGMNALREKREAWKKMVAKKEEQGQSPYVMRWAKASFFPLVYFGMSMIIVRNLRYEWSDFYDYDSFYILMGLVVGFIFLVVAAASTMARAKRVRKPILLKNKMTWIGLIVFVGISFYLAFSQGLAYTWLFSIGFLGAGLLIVALGFLMEKSGNGVFWVKDPVEGSDKRWLEFVPTTEG